MRLQRNSNITGYPFQFICCQCRRCVTSTQGYYADLDGKPFEAYYCIPCGSAKEIIHDRTKGAAHHDKP